MPASSWPGGHAVPAAFVDWGFPVDDALPENVAYRQLPSPPRDDADWATRRFSFNNIEAGSVQPVVVALGPPLTGAPGRLLPRASSPRTWLTCPRRSKSGRREPHKLSRGTNDALDKATPARLRAFRPVRVDPEHVQVYPPVLFFFSHLSM